MTADPGGGYLFRGIPLVGIGLTLCQAALGNNWSITHPDPRTTYTKWSNVGGQGNTGGTSQSFCYQFRHNQDGAVMQEAEVASDDVGAWVKTLSAPQNGWDVAYNHEVQCQQGAIEKAQNAPIMVINTGPRGLKSGALVSWQALNERGKAAADFPLAEG